MLVAIILVCAAAEMASCDQTNADDVLIVPATFASPVSCLMQGQAFLASLATGQFDTRRYRMKVICRSGPIEDLARQKRKGPRSRRLT